MLGKTYQGQECALASALEVVGERWTLLVVRDAFYGVQRFSDFVDHLDIPRAVLSDRLRNLVAAGVLDRIGDPDHAGRSLYRLTPMGHELWPTVHALARWGSRLRPNGSPRRRFVHATCDNELDDHASCPRCELTPPPSDIVMEWVPSSTPLLPTDLISVALTEPHRLLEPIGPARSTTPALSSASPVPPADVTDTEFDRC